MMKIAELDPWMTTLGWTLLHSLWQGVIVYLLLLLIRRMLPSASASVKYAFATGSMAAILLCSAGTFICILQRSPTALPASNEIISLPGDVFSTTAMEANPLTSLLAISRWINNQIQWIVGAWMIGALFFGIRLMKAWWHTRQIQLEGDSIVGFWKTRLQELALDCGISRTILLLQSRLIDAPILLGYVKPVILLPVGMLSGLSTEQVETILLHELAHIQRSDYIVNLVQSFAEVIFFFNPWVWAISSEICLEREQCCDDRVVKVRSPLAYAQALHQLEEARSIDPTFVLAASGRKNQLLKRIKRIMEPSEKKEEGREKVFPALLVIVALLGASWFSIQAYHPEIKYEPGTGPERRNVAPIADTTKKDLKKEKSATYSRKSVTPYDEKGEPHQELTEEFSGNEDMRPMLSPLDLHIDIPALAPFPAVEAIPEVEALTEMAPFAPFAPGNPEGMNFYIPFLDSLPGRSFGLQNDRDWENFGKEFTEKFRERFSDFYQKNQPEFENMMNELEKKMEKARAGMDEIRFADAEWEKEMHHLQKELEVLAPRQEQFMQRHQAGMKKLEQEMIRKNYELESKMKDHEYYMKSMESKMKAFEEELKVELVKDGYLAKDEPIKSMNWNDDGTIEVNGKKIKDLDKNKYQELHKKYFRGGKHFRYVE